MTGPDFFAALFSSNSAMIGQKSTSGSEKRVQEKQGKPEHLTIWGRANSVNVQKVLWCLAELDLAYQRIDAGMAFRTTGPNGRVPTLVDGDYVLWESNSIMRYLNLAYGGGSPIYPPSPQARAAVDRWLDWTLSTLQPVDRPVFWALVRTPVENATWSRSRKMSMPKPWSGAFPRRCSQAAASSRVISSQLPISPSAPLPGAGSGSRASPSQNCQTSSAGSRRFRSVRDLQNSSRRRCRDG
jgi:hypothetical protein